MQSIFAHSTTDSFDNFVGELGKKWEFPSDHLPIGVDVDGIGLCSWNILNTLFLRHIESNTQGLKDSLILEANRPCRPGSLLTVREKMTVKMVVSMTKMGRASRHIIGLQEVGDAVLAKLKQKLPSYMTLVTDCSDSCSSGNQDVIIYDCRRFIPLAYTVTQYSRKNSIMDLVLLDRTTQKKYQIINTHTPGGPTGSEALRELCQYVLRHYQSGVESLFMGDINQFAEQIDAALTTSAREMAIDTPFSRTPIGYPSHINTHQQAVSIDHIYTTSKNVKGQDPEKLIKGLSAITSLLTSDF